MSEIQDGMTMMDLFSLVGLYTLWLFSIWWHRPFFRLRDIFPCCFFDHFLCLFPLLLLLHLKLVPAHPSTTLHGITSFCQAWGHFRSQWALGMSGQCLLLRIASVLVFVLNQEQKHSCSCHHSYIFIGLWNILMIRHLKVNIFTSLKKKKTVF